MQLHFDSFKVLQDTFDKVEGMASDDQLTALIEDFRHCMVLPNQMLYLISYNPQKVLFARNVFRFLGIPDSEFCIADAISTIHPEEQSFITEGVKTLFEWSHMHALKVKSIYSALEYRILNKLGKVYFVQRITRAIEVDENNYPRVTMSLVTDITPTHSGSFKPKLAIFNPYTHEQLYFKSKDMETELSLTARELEVLKCLCLGLSSKQIADKLFISRHTVDGHRRTLLEKTGLTNTTEMVSFALKYQVVEIY